MNVLKKAVFTSMIVLLVGAFGVGMAAADCAELDFDDLAIDIPCLMFGGVQYRARLPYDPGITGGFYFKLDTNSVAFVGGSTSSAGGQCAELDAGDFTIDIPCLMVYSVQYRARLLYDPGVAGGAYFKLDMNALEIVADSTSDGFGQGACEDSTITLAIDGETETLSLISYQGFERGFDGLYSCAWNSWNGESSEDQVLVTGISQGVAAGTSFVMSNSDPSHVSLIWNNNAYIPLSFTITFTTWEGTGGIAGGTISATLFNAPLGKTITLTDVKFCAPVVD